MMYVQPFDQELFDYEAPVLVHEEEQVVAGENYECVFQHMLSADKKSIKVHRNRMAQALSNLYHVSLGYQDANGGVDRILKKRSTMVRQNHVKRALRRRLADAFTDHVYEGFVFYMPINEKCSVSVHAFADDKKTLVSGLRDPQAHFAQLPKRMQAAGIYLLNQDTNENQDVDESIVNRIQSLVKSEIERQEAAVERRETRQLRREQR